MARIAGVGDKDDAPAVAPVAAVGAALGNELLAPERDAPRPAVAGADVDLGLVEELHELLDCPLSRAMTTLRTLGNLTAPISG